MLVRNFTYKGVSLSESVARSTKILVQKVDKPINMRTQVFERQNWHGSFTSGTLASGRLFTVRGVIFGATRADRAIGQEIINGIIVPESNPGTGVGFYDMLFTDDSGNVHLTSAKVYSMPTYGRDIGSDIIDFSFELYAEDPRTTSQALNDEAGGLGYYGGVSLPAALPFALDSHSIGKITVTNAGNFAASCKVTVTGTVENTRIHNHTNGRYYGVSTTTTEFVHDDTGSEFSVTDAGVDVSGYRIAGGRIVTLEPGDNDILVTGSNYPSDSVTVSVQWRDTFMTS